MKNIDEHIDLIERYLYDDLTQVELDEFNDLLREDPEFNKLFYEMDHLLDGIRRSAKQTTVEEKLARLEEALPEKTESKEQVRILPVISFKDFKNNYKMAIAATLSLLLVSTIVITNLNSNKNPDDLFVQYFKTYENIGGIERGKSDVERLQYAMIEYDKGNYERSIQIFEQIEISDENKFEIWLYGGNAYLSLNRLNEAKNSFNNIIEANFEFVNDAKWYLSLCYIKEGNVELAKPLLQEVKESGRAQYKEAEELLNELK